MNMSLETKSDKTPFLGKPAWHFWLAASLLALIVRLIANIYWQRAHLDSFVAADPFVPLAKYWLGWLPDLNEADQQRCSPGFALFCALVFKIWGSGDDKIILILNIIFSSVSCALLGFLSYRYFGKAVSILSAFWMTLSPPLIGFSFVLQSETFFIMLLLLFFIGLVERWDGAGHLEAAAYGIFAGVVNLARSVFIIYSPFVFGYFIFRAMRLKKKGFVKIIIFSIGWTLPICAWTYRNWKTFHEFIPLTVQSGEGLFLGLTIDPLTPDRYLREEEQKMKLLGITRAIDHDRYLMRKSLEQIRAHPVYQAKISIRKFFQFWRPWPYPPYSLKIRIGLGIYYSVVFLLALSGLWCSRKNWLDLLPIYAFFICTSLINAIFFSNLRYRIPLEPFLISFACAGLIKAKSASEEIEIK